MAPSVEQQTKTYNQLVELVKDNIPDDFMVTEAPGRIEVNTQKAVIIEGRNRTFLNLLSVIIQKHHVGFYFMPMYVNADLRAGLSEPLAKMLKGKSCFHCTDELSSELQTEFAGLIGAGVELYRQKGWI